MVRKILIGSSAVVAGLLLVVAAQPATFHIERSISVAAPAEKAFALVNDFRSWTSWSPYEKIDPEMQRTYEGAPAGSGAIYSWAGKEAGKGRMTLRKSEPPSKISIELAFIEPLEATNTATFTFVPDPNGTKVTWAMDGRYDFLGKAASLVMDMDELVGADFERGLADLKSAAESASKSDAQAANVAK